MMSEVKELLDELASLSQELEDNPCATDLWLLRGWVHLDLGRSACAIKDFASAISLDPTLAVAYSGLGCGYADYHEYDKSLKMFDRAIELSPISASYWFGRGSQYQKLGTFDKALADFDEAIRLNPEREKYHAFRGKLYYDLKNWRRAEEDFKRAVQLDPQRTTCYFPYGLMQFAQRKYEAANAAFYQALAQKPPWWNCDCAVIYLFLSLCFLGMGERAEKELAAIGYAVIRYETWLEPILRFFLGEIAEEQVFFEFERICNCRKNKHMKWERNGIEVQYFLGLFHFSNGRREKARPYLAAYLSSDAASPEREFVQGLIDELGQGDA